MAKQLYPSSFLCNCGHESDFFENTVTAMEKMSKKKETRIGDSEDNEHTIIFNKGAAVEILCPKLGRCKITEIE
ncbi:MAG: hypothetical protein U9Q91_06310 [Candidatus Marinimicrobia bacterium]|nr:hypothetical protein [Candidatus Neomarinimicrobiota bacterium]